MAAGAWAEWLPQGTILFDRARLRRRLEIAVEAGGRLLACEALVLGRTARSEVVSDGFVHDARRVRWGGRLVFADALRLDGGIDALGRRRATLDGARSCERAAADRGGCT